MVINKIKKLLILSFVMVLFLSSCTANKIENNLDETIKMFFTQKYYKLEKDTNKIRLSESLEKFLAKKPDYKYYELSELKILDKYKSKDKILVLVKTLISTRDKKSGEGAIVRILLYKDNKGYIVEKEVSEDMIESANYQTKLSQKDIKNYIKKSLVMNGDNLSDSEIDKNIKDFDLFNFYSYIGMFEVQKSKETNEDLIRVLENHEYK